MNIYVGNLPYSVRDDELRKTFEEFGEVKSAEVIVDRRSNRSRGYGFVQMGNDKATNDAISGLNGRELHGRTLRVDRSRPKAQKEQDGRSRNRRSGSQPAPQAAANDQKRGGIMGFIKRLVS